MSRGGYRYGAGRPGWRQKIELCLRLDVNHLRRCGLLQRRDWTSWRWTNSYTGEEVGSIAIFAEEGRLILSYRANETSVRFPLYLTNTPCTFGGTRPWFQCPSCYRRCGVVAFSRGTWACRKCLNLAYSSEAEGASDRLWRKQRKLEALVGEDWIRPKRMRHATYARICEQLADIEQQKDELLIPALARMLGISPP